MLRAALLDRFKVGVCHAFQQQEGLDLYREDFSIRIQCEFSQVGVLFYQPASNQVFLIFIFDLTKDTLDRQGLALVSSRPCIYIPRVDHEAHRWIVHQVAVLLRQLVSDHVDFAACLIGYVGHKRTIWLVFGGCCKDADVFFFHESQYFFKHRSPFRFLSRVHP
jgi:hypothetical protein